MKGADWMKRIGAVAGACAVACLLSAPAQGAGETVYKAKCVGCHAADGSGNTPAGKAMKAPSFSSDDAKKKTDAEWTEIIVKGKNKMPAYDKKISSDEIEEVIAYIRSLSKK